MSEEHHGAGASARSFVLVTPAHNEADHLDALFRSILALDRRPDHWVVCDDGSADDTGPRAIELAEGTGFITVLHRPRRHDRQINSKADVVAEAYTEAIRHCPDADFVVSLDADVELPADTFTFLLDRFEEDPELGLAGGIYRYDDTETGEAGRVRPHHVPGPLQMFRREVFDAIGGYQALPDGGLDVVAGARARMLGWRTTAFPELVYQHNRRMGTGGGRRLLVAAFHGGVRDRSLGAGLPFMLVKTVRRIDDRPFVLSALARLAGFLHSAITRRPIALDPELLAFIRAEQRQRVIPGPLGRRLSPTETAALPAR